MSILGIGSQPQTQAVQAAGPQQGTLATGGGIGSIVQMAGSGATMAQPNSPNLIKRILIGGLGGAGIGAAIGLIPATFPLVGPLFAGVSVPMGAAIGAGAGALLGIVSYALSKRKQTLGLKAQQAQQAQGVVPSQGMPILPSKVVQGKTLRLGDSGADVKWTQRALKKIGVYNGKVTGKVDAATASAIKRYEMLKGAMPTGDISPDLRTALSVDMRVHSQFA